MPELGPSRCSAIHPHLSQSHCLNVIYQAEILPRDHYCTTEPSIHPECENTDTQSSASRLPCLTSPKTTHNTTSMEPHCAFHPSSTLLPKFFLLFGTIFPQSRRWNPAIRGIDSRLAFPYQQDASLCPKSAFALHRKPASLLDYLRPTTSWSISCEVRNLLGISTVSNSHAALLMSRFLL